MESAAQSFVPQSRNRNTITKEWQDHKETIHRLYLVERRTLDKVMELMSSAPCHFHRSEREYKYRLRLWGFNIKNAKRRTPGTTRRRSHIGDPQTPTRVAPSGPSPVNMIQSDVDNQIEHEVLSSQREISLQSHIGSLDGNVVTSPMLHRPFISPPPMLAVSELILMLARQQCEIIPDKTKEMVNNDKTITNTLGNKDETDSLDNFFGLVRLAVPFLQQRPDHQEGWKTLDKVCHMIKRIIQKCGVRGLKRFVDAAIYLGQAGLAAIAKFLMKFIGKMAKSLKLTVIAKVFKLFSTYEPVDLPAILARAWQAGTGFFSSDVPNLQ